MKPLYIPGALSYRMRSPFEVAQTPGIPPAYPAVPGVSFVNGTPTINGVPLPTTDAVPRDSALLAPSDLPAPIAQYDPAKYSDSIVFAVTFAGAQEILALPRPQTTRILLVIQSITVVGNIFFCFDRVASATSCIAIGPGGNRLYDGVVPQGDLHIFSTGAGIVAFEYMNRDISKLSYK